MHVETVFLYPGWSTDPKTHKTRIQHEYSSDEHNAIFQELVLWNFKVVGGGATSDTTTAIIMGAVARAEPAMVITSIRHWHTAKMGAYSKAYNPLHQRSQSAHVIHGVSVPSKLCWAAEQQIKGLTLGNRAYNT